MIEIEIIVGSEEYDFATGVAVVRSDIQKHFLTSGIFITIPGLNEYVGITNTVEV